MVAAFRLPNRPSRPIWRTPPAQSAAKAASRSGDEEPLRIADACSGKRGQVIRPDWPMYRARSDDRGLRRVKIPCAKNRNS
jgi:hypothetical protein